MITISKLIEYKDWQMRNNRTTIVPHYSEIEDIIIYFYLREFMLKLTLTDCEIKIVNDWMKEIEKRFRRYRYYEDNSQIQSVLLLEDNTPINQE